MEQFLTYPKFRGIDSNGDPLSGGLVYTYATGGSTPKETYSDYAKTTPNANPVVLDSSGEAEIYLGEGGYRVVLKTSADVTLWTMDDVYGTLGPIAVTCYANENQIANADGEIDGEIAVDAATGNIYTWDEGEDKWRVRSGNVYVSNPSIGTFMIETGTMIYQTTDDTIKDWTGFAWQDTLAQGFTEADLKGAIISRPLFTYKDGDEIYVDPFAIHHNGTADQIVFSDATITFVLESTGSNSDSDDFPTSSWQYIYIDDSAVVAKGDAEITAAQLIAIDAPPVWSDAKHGWYGSTNSNDRCIFAIRTNSTPAIKPFHHDGHTKVTFDAEYEEHTTITAAWAEYAITHIPRCSSRGVFSVYLNHTLARAASARQLDSGAAGKIIARVTADTNDCYVICDLETNDDATSRRVELLLDTAGFTTFSLRTQGFYLGQGM